MFRRIITLTIFLMFGLCSNYLFAQQKYEKESRIKSKDVPSEAMNFIDSINVGNKIKWYIEEGLQTKSIEAKFKYKSKKYSIEFDTLGNIEDAEIEIKWDEMQTPFKDSISSQLKKDCLKQKIVKVQIQYSGTSSEILSKLRENKISGNLTSKYEVVVRCKSKDTVVLFEYLFNKTAQVVSRSEIIFKNSSHLEY